MKYRERIQAGAEINRMLKDLQAKWPQTSDDGERSKQRELLKTLEMRLALL